MTYLGLESADHLRRVVWLGMRPIFEGSGMSKVPKLAGQHFWFLIS